MMTEKVFADPTWAIVELFGRQVIAGQVLEVTIAGTDMLRVDVPQTDSIAAYTKFYGGGAIYGITPTDEASALHAVAHLAVRPINRWTIPERQIPAMVDDDGYDTEGGGFVEDEEIEF